VQRLAAPVYRHYYGAKKRACFSNKCRTMLVYILVPTRGVYRRFDDNDDDLVKNNYNFITQCTNIHCMGSTKYRAKVADLLTNNIEEQIYNLIIATLLRVRMF